MGWFEYITKKDYSEAIKVTIEMNFEEISEIRRS